MNRFIGRFVHQLDEKGRVSLPAQFRRGLDADSFVLMQVQADALTLYPPETWQGVQEKLVEMRQRLPGTRHYLLGRISNAHDVTPDKQGRILIPEHLRTLAGLESQVLILGAIDRMEIWDPIRFQKSIEAGADYERLDQIATSVFG